MLLSNICSYVERMPIQRSFEDLGTPLSAVTFCVIDLETTGGSAAEDAITEIGAVKVRCGETLGTFQTLVDPGREVPAFIRLLTGISRDMLVEAPSIEAVLPSLLEFVRGTVLVAHNARFDVSFLNAALARNDYPTLSNRVVDTATIARKTLAGEVPNNKLSTLAGYLRCAHQPSHRAYADALATTDLLHHLIERVAGYGVNTLEDLCAMSFTRMDGTWHKISLADDLPRGIGVYRFVGAAGATLYIGKATDLRARVRSYFYGDPRRKIRDLLRETQGIVVEPHATTLEAEVAEARAIAEESPPYNRAGKKKPIWYLKVTLDRPRARMSRVRTPRSDGAIYVGPLEARAVQALMDAARDALTIHRCSEPARCRGCVFSQMGTCSGRDPESHREDLRRLAVALEVEPRRLLEPLLARMNRLAASERFEEAAEVRERGALLERALVHRHEVGALRRAGDVVLTIGERAIWLRCGRLAGAVDISEDDDRVVRAWMSGPGLPEMPPYMTSAAAREGRVIASWLRRHASEVRILHASGTWSWPAAARPGGLFRPRSDPAVRDRARAAQTA